MAPEFWKIENIWSKTSGEYCPLHQLSWLLAKLFNFDCRGKSWLHDCKSCIGLDCRWLNAIGQHLSHFHYIQTRPGMLPENWKIFSVQPNWGNDKTTPDKTGQNSKYHRLRFSHQDIFLVDLERRMFWCEKRVRWYLELSRVIGSRRSDGQWLFVLEHLQTPSYRLCFSHQNIFLVDLDGHVHIVWVVGKHVQGNWIQQIRLTVTQSCNHQMATASYIISYNDIHILYHICFIHHILVSTLTLLLAHWKSVWK